MTNTREFRPRALSVVVAPARQRHHELIDAACAWQVARERQPCPDHFALICAAVDDAAAVPGAPPTPNRWTRTEAYHVLRCDIPNWCSRHGCLWPAELPQIMWQWFDFLHATGHLHPDSDPVAELRKPLACAGGLDQDGAPLPAGAAGSLPCECLLPYRETTELLSELVRQCERSGDDPLDALRLLVGRPARTPPDPWFGDELDLGQDLDRWRWEPGGDEGDRPG
jgi:hypothetical protein